MMKPAVAVAVLAMALAGCGRQEERAAADTRHTAPSAQPGQIDLPADSPKLKQLRIEAVTLAEVPTDEVTSPGKVESNPNRMSHVALPVAGRVMRSFVRLGDAVRQGDPLFELESPDIDSAESAYLQAQAAVTQAKALVSKSQADYDRARDLFENNAVAKKEVTNAEALLTQSHTGLEQAVASVEQARRRLEILGVKPGQFGQRLTVRAPLSGKVLEMNIVPGEFRNDLSAPVITIADLSSVWITSDVPETSIRLIQPGERIDIELNAYPGETFRGRVTRIADIVDPQTRTVKVRAEIDNRGGRLRPEMFGRIRLVDHIRPVPVVPAAAVVQGEGQSYVFRVTGPGSFTQTPVGLGGRAGDKIAVVHGLSAGDRIVTDGVMLLKTAP